MAVAATPFSGKGSSQLETPPTRDDSNYEVCSPDLHKTKAKAARNSLEWEIRQGPKQTNRGRIEIGSLFSGKSYEWSTSIDAKEPYQGYSKTRTDQ